MRFSTNLDKYRQYDLPKLPLLSAIRCPTLIIHGESDSNCPIEAVRRAQTALGGSSAMDRITFRYLSGHDHSFRSISSDTNFLEAMQLPLSQEYVNELLRFLNGQAIKPSRGPVDTRFDNDEISIQDCRDVDLENLRQHFVPELQQSDQVALLEGRTLTEDEIAGQNPRYIKFVNVTGEPFGYAYYWYLPRCQTA